MVLLRTSTAMLVLRVRYKKKWCRGESCMHNLQTEFREDRYKTKARKKE
jgi:hypothetical protein